MPGYFNPLQNYVPPAETLDALPPQPFTYTPPPPPSYIAPAPSLEEMYTQMQPYMQTDVRPSYDYYSPDVDAQFARYRHAANALPSDMDFYDKMMNLAVLSNQLDRRVDSAMARQNRYWDAHMDGMLLPQLMTRGAW